jgi:hypothetical protein
MSGLPPQLSMMHSIAVHIYAESNLYLLCTKFNRLEELIIIVFGRFQWRIHSGSIIVMDWHWGLGWQSHDALA